MIYRFSGYVRKNERDDDWYIIGINDWERHGDHAHHGTSKSVMLGVFFFFNTYHELLWQNFFDYYLNVSYEGKKKIQPIKKWGKKKNSL